MLPTNLKEFVSTFLKGIIIVRFAKSFNATYHFPTIQYKFCSGDVNRMDRLSERLDRSRLIKYYLNTYCSEFFKYLGNDHMPLINPAT